MDSPITLLIISPTFVVAAGTAACTPEVPLVTRNNRKHFGGLACKGDTTFCSQK
jgi:hypothetical protein